MRRLRLGGHPSSGWASSKSRRGLCRHAPRIGSRHLARTGILAQIEQTFRTEDDLAGLKKQYASLIETYPKRISLQRRRCRLLADLGENDEPSKATPRAILEELRARRPRKPAREYVECSGRNGAIRSGPSRSLTRCAGRTRRTPNCKSGSPKTLHQAKQPAKAVDAVKQYLKVSDRSAYAHLRARADCSKLSATRKTPKTFYKTPGRGFCRLALGPRSVCGVSYADGQKTRCAGDLEKTDADGRRQPRDEHRQGG